MLILFLVFAFIRTLRGAALSTLSDSPNQLLNLDLRDTESHFGQRTVNGIIISCFTTIFACTWSAIHPNIPAPTDCWWTRFKRQVVMMIYALLAPEMIAMWAVSQRLAARVIADMYNEEILEAQPNDPTERSFLQTLFQDSPSSHAFPRPQWTLTHGFFLQMGGFMLCENGRPIQTLADDNPSYAMEIIKNIKMGRIDAPRISEEDIRDRSKGDAISKTLIILQTTWFIVQCVARWAQHLPVTELEVVTLAFAMLNGITYGLWWNKPQNVGRPVFLETKKPIGNSIRIPAELHPTPGKESWLRREIRQEIEEESAWVLVQIIPLRLIWAVIRPLGKMFGYDGLGTNALRVGMFFAPETSNNHFTQAGLTMMATGTLFGTVHLVPTWFLDFSSRQEMWLWRISAIIVAGEPILSPIAMIFVDRDDNSLLANIFGVTWIIGIPLYIVSRIILLILPLISLRSLPPAALQTIKWTTFIPHL